MLCPFELRARELAFLLADDIISFALAKVKAARRCAHIAKQAQFVR